ncbi:MAG: ABC transporter permease [Flavobacteriales bacterium]|nr:ABC transporter permease [Flavobacteriales bacterium]MDG1780271.1 ABC transporter permease [Flavobacteriales bacterium]MDG2244786.1 ABC transporter permease [Flavobacteriales bacterium]
MQLFTHIGRYFLLMSNVFRRPEKWKLFFKATVQEIDKIGVQSLGIVALLSLFMGAVICIQTAANIDSGWIPLYTIGFTVRQTMILEFAPTIIPVIMAGKVGSNISSEIGTMRISEQIDALDIMGVNSANYLILPKIVGAIFIFPFLIIMAMFLGVTAGALIGVLADLLPLADFETGIQYDFRPYQVVYSLFKTIVFAFIIVSISAYHGYFTRGGALEVGKSSTQAVVYSIVLIMVANLLITQLILT